jgi:hypothetical protein
MPNQPSLVRFLLVLSLLPALLPAQEPDRDQMARVLARLDALEQQNKELLAEVRALRQQVASVSPGTPEAPANPATPETAAPAAEQVAIAEQQIKDLAQTRVESDHRGPVQLTGMALFNSFFNGRDSGTAQDPTAASINAGPRTAGASLRQTIIGLKFQAPEKIAGIDISGSAYMDFFAGTGTALNQLMRLRVASINFSWKDTTFTVAQDKPIISPREPDSLAQVGVSPLTGSGNLWLWSPQARVEQDFHFGETAGLRAQVGVYQTAERNNAPSEYASTIGSGRPGLEGRFVFWTAAGDGSRFEIAPGFHVSDSHVNGSTIPSRIVSLDWRVPLTRILELTGTYFHGQNTGVIGGLSPGIVESGDDILHAVRGQGGWAQLKVQATSRLTFDIYGGQEDYKNRDLLKGMIGKNQTYAANAIYRVTSNILASFEYSYLRSTYVGVGNRFNPHYDLAFAYLF